MLNGKDEYNRPITEETLCETINTCMEIISTIFKGEFVWYKIVVEDMGNL